MADCDACLAAKQKPHRPGIAPAIGLCAFFAHSFSGFDEENR
jgi:hypothetical protein